MKYWLAGAALGLLVAGTALAQPAPVGGSVGGTVNGTVGQTGTAAGGAASGALQTPPPPPAPSDPAGRIDDRVNAPLPPAGADGTATASTPRGTASARGKTKTSRDDTTAEGSVSAGKTGG